MTCTILYGLKNLLEEKVEKIRKKYGAEVTLEFGEPFIQNNHKYVEVTVDGQYKIDGYEFVATLDFDPDCGRNIIKGVSNIEIPSEYFTRCECDHCKTDVRTRKHTVLLYKEGVGFVQVGKTCLKEYIGISANSYASYLSWFETIDEYIDKLNEEHIGFDKRFYDVDDVLEQTVEHIKKYGYISRAMLDRLVDEGHVDLPTTTASDIYNLITERKNMLGEIIVERHEVYAGTKEIVVEIKRLVKESPDTNSWINNLKVLISHSSVGEENIGLLSSAYSLYLKNNKEKTEREICQSDYVGNVGDRIEFTATPECVYSIDGEYGYIYIYKFVVGNDILVWKTSKCLDSVAMTLKGTVKAHNEYRGTKQTEITRARVVSVEKPVEKVHEPGTDSVQKAFDEFWSYFEN
jgi:hypothetical protein